MTTPAARLKVLHVYRTYYPDPPGGLQEAIRQICLCMQPFGVDSTIFTLSPQPHPTVLQRPEGRVVRERSWAAPASCDLGGFKAFARFRALAREADVVHYLFPWPFADVLHHIVRPAAPKVMTYISDIVRQRVMGAVYAPVMWRTLRDMDAIVSNAPGYAQNSPVLSGPGLRARLRVIPLGIEEASYPSPQQADFTVLPRLGLAPGQPFFLFIGALRYYKGLQFLLQAARDVDAPIVIAGTGPLQGQLLEEARRLGLNQVHMAGAVTEEEKSALLQACHALVLPSHLRSEAYGMVLVEAAMHGRPMVSCEIGTGTSYVNEDGVTGWVVPPQDPPALALAMNRLLQEPEQAATMGLAARQRYEGLFSGGAVGRAYADLFRSVASGAGV